jgi:hypothetical protein
MTFTPAQPSPLTRGFRLHMQKLSAETAHTCCLEKEDSITPSFAGKTRRVESHTLTSATSY